MPNCKCCGAPISVNRDMYTEYKGLCSLCLLEDNNKKVTPMPTDKDFEAKEFQRIEQNYIRTLSICAENLLSAEEKSFMVAGNKIQAIKSLRSRLFCGLKEAKTIVDAYEQSDSLRKVTVELTVKEQCYLHKLVHADSYTRNDQHELLTKLNPDK